MKHEIMIRLDQSPQRHTIVTVNPNPCYIRRGDTVQWVCEGGHPIAIHFDPLSPLEHRRLRASQGVIEEQVRDGILPGKYRYLVAVFSEGEIYTEDPELIDENN